MIGRSAGGYVNLLSHSPVDTPYPGYRYREVGEALLEDVAPLIAATPPSARRATAAAIVVAGPNRRSEEICPVQIHAQELASNEHRQQRQRQQQEAQRQRRWQRRSLERERPRPKDKEKEASRRRARNTSTTKKDGDRDSNSARKWIDLDENILDGYILIDDSCVESAVPVNDEETEALVPYFEGVDEIDSDADSHGNYESVMFENPRGNELEIDANVGNYPLANSHGNFYQESSSHNKYSELMARLMSVRNVMELLRRNDDNDDNEDDNNDDDNNEHLENEDNEENEVGVIDYAMANSHSDYSIDGTRFCAENFHRAEGLVPWDTRPNGNYEIANSHSNYRVFYDSQSQYRDLRTPPLPPLSPMSRSKWLTAASQVQPQNDRGSGSQPEESTEEERKNDSKEDESTTTTTTTAADNRLTMKLQENVESAVGGTNCDIEQCLVQIEESLLNIEQNLLQVQDLDLPELRNLLYKSPNIERSLFEVQDFLYAEDDAKTKMLSLDFEEDDNDDVDDENEDEEEGEEEDEKEEESWMEQKLTIKDEGENEDEDGNTNAALFGASTEEVSSDTANQDDNNPSRSTDEPSNNDDWPEADNSNGPTQTDGSSDPNGFQADPEKPVNFVPNSLGRTAPRRIVLEESSDNIRLCSSSEHSDDSVVDYNLNNPRIEKKLLCRDKCHSRTNSLDEDSSFRDFADRRSKISLQNIFLDGGNDHRLLRVSGKAMSEGTLQNRRDPRRNREDRSGSNETRASKADSQATHRRSTIVNSASNPNSNVIGVTTAPSCATTDNQGKSRESRSHQIDFIEKEASSRSPTKPRRTSSASNDNRCQDRESMLSSGRPTGCDKQRKRKKLIGRIQGSSENALVPSKLISLSLSLLLAALLQAVRCLTDLVEDAFRSVSYDRTGLLQ